MNKAMRWIESKQYQWFRKEYLRAFDICVWIIISLLLGLSGYVIYCDAMAVTLDKDIAILLWGLTVASCAVAVAMRLVDDHEKKIAKK